MNPAIRRFVAALAVLLIPAASAAGAGSIFDDDWKPPKASDTPRPTAVKPATPAPADAKPAVTPADPAPKDPSPDGPAARRPVPAPPEQAAVRKLMKDVYAAELRDTSAAARLKLAGTLIAQADKSAQRPVEQFVLLAAAIDSSVEALSLPRALEAAGKLAGAFDVDGPAVKADAATRVNARPPRPDTAEDNARSCFALVTELLAGEDFAAAAKVCSAAQTLAGNNPGLRAEAQRRLREVTAARDARGRVSKDIEKLATSPDDPQANLAVGKYLCYTKGDWRGGLPTLFRGSDPALKRLAEQELVAGDKSEAHLAVADAWWDVGERGPAVSRDAVQAHAAEHYAKALPELQGLVRTKVQKRIADVAARGGMAGAGTVWNFIAESTDHLFPLGEPGIPDELSVESLTQRARITGKKKVERGRALGRDVWHMGKAVTFAGRENAGTLDAPVPYNGDNAHYYLIVAGADGRMSSKEFRPELGVRYAWRFAQSGKECTLAVFESGGKAVGSVSMSAADATGFGFGASVRHVGDEADLIITLRR